MDLSAIGRGLDRLASHPLTALDLRWVGRLRALVGATLLVDLSLRLMTLLHGEDRLFVLSDGIGQSFAAGWSPSVAIGLQRPEALLVFACVNLVALVALTLGMGTALSGPVSLICLAGWIFKHPAELSADGVMALCCLGLLCAVPSAAYGSLDARRGGERVRVSARHATAGAWLLPVSMLAAALVDGSAAAAGPRWASDAGGGLSTALADAVSLPPAGAALLGVGADPVNAIGGLTEALAVLGAALFLLPVRPRIARWVGLGCWFASGLVVSALTWVSALAWVWIWMPVGWLMGAEPETARSDRRESYNIRVWSRDLEGRLGLLTRELVAVAVLGAILVAGVRRSSGESSSVARPVDAITSRADAHRGALLRLEARGDREHVTPAVAAGPWPALPVLARSCALQGDNAAGDVLHLSGDGWRAGPAPTSDLATWRARRRGWRLQALDLRMYREGHLELERVAFGAGGSRAQLEGRGPASEATGVDSGVEVREVEFRCAARAFAGSPRLGEPEIRFVGRRDDTTQTRLVPRGASR